MNDQKIYHINNSTITLKFGDLFDSKADVLVISGSVGLPMEGGLPRVARKRAGESVLNDASKHAGARLGDVVVTGAGRLENKYLFHSVMVANYAKVLPDSKREVDREVCEYIIGYSISKSLRLLNSMELTSIAFPCLGLGMANMPVDMVAKATARTMCRFLSRTNRPLNIEIYLRDTYSIYSRFDYLPFFEWFAAYSYATQRDTERNDLPSAEPDTDRFSDVAISDITATAAPAHRVFISYSRHDTEKARGVCDLLNRMNVPYWIDINGVYSGANFKELIVKAISSADIVLFLSSENSNRSTNVAKEIGIADKYNKVIIPVRLDASPLNPKMDYDLAGIDFVDLSAFDDKNLTKLKNAILGHLAMKNSK